VKPDRWSLLVTDYSMPEMDGLARARCASCAQISR
jgi:CheY-like chemotaxis protein